MLFPCREDCLSKGIFSLYTPLRNLALMGIATYMYEMLIRLAKERGLKGFTAKVLQANKVMMKVFENGHLPINAKLRNGVYKLKIPFDTQSSHPKNNM